ncbi:MAG: hypothetical protein O6945_17570 [Gammaproteobacteria bacterium]|nr:hypothetical protein [Gammaproteobacteria bacterium]
MLRFPSFLFCAFTCVALSNHLRADDANYFLIRYLPGENWNHSISYEDQPGLRKHHSYLQKLHINDQVVMGGPVDGEPGSLMLVKTGSREEAEVIARQDPGVETRIVKAEITAWYVQMSSMRFVRRQPVPPIEDPDQTFRLKRIDRESQINLED